MYYLMLSLKEFDQIRHNPDSETLSSKSIYSINWKSNAASSIYFQFFYNYFICKKNQVVSK